MTSKKRGNLRLKAYNTIKQEIVTLKLPPGSYLEKEKLQKRLNVGLTPVREALLQLEAEDLVIAVSNKGFYVKNLDFHSIKDLLENRMFLERYVAFLAVSRITEKEIDELEEIASEMRQLAENNGEYELVMKDMEFHSLLVKSTRNNQLEKIMSPIYNECLRIWFISHYEELDESVEMHFNLLKVLRQRDWDSVEKAIIEHNMVFQKRVAHYFERLFSTGYSGQKDFSPMLSVKNEKPL